ncbi:uncharacterized protein FIBRA_08827 [Fibroporia radiculosa]|uniref:Uncharacterized protein n=1 Tax=Fibroporia radiculosa TaxID=599839 RepID=J4I3D7_9APHY|nr:uncharacterized protein FIBRA_08827 [Fibroporia radiculosa]CCM06552.1 predicted protein [Fibroporia radiculosa]
MQVPKSVSTPRFRDDERRRKLEIGPSYAEGGGCARPAVPETHAVRITICRPESDAPAPLVTVPIVLRGALSLVVDRWSWQRRWRGRVNDGRAVFFRGPVWSPNRPVLDPKGWPPACRGTPRHVRRAPASSALHGVSVKRVQDGGGKWGKQSGERHVA